MPEHTAVGVCLERMHRIFSELLVLAQRYNPVEAGPCRVSWYLKRLKRLLFSYFGSWGLMLFPRVAQSIVDAH